jgi:ABC-type transporter Mla subunit MlaD
MNQESSRQALRAGVFFIAAISIFVGAALWVSGSEWLRGPMRSYQVDIADAGELSVGDGVYVAGVAVGTVADISVRLNSPTPVSLTIEVPKSMILREDSSARVIMLDLLGGMALDVDPGSPNAQPLEAGDHLSGVASAGPQELLARSGEVFTQVTAVVKQSRQILAGISGQLPTTSDRISDFSRSATSVARRLEKFTADIEQSLPRVLSRAEHATALTVSVMARAKSAVSSIESLTTKLDNVLGARGEHIKTAIGQAQATLKTTGAAAATVADNRAAIDQTLANLSQAAAYLKVFSQQISEQPYSLLRVLPTQDRTPGEPMDASSP